MSCGGGGSNGASPAPSFSPSVLTKSASNTVIAALTLGTQGISERQVLPQVLPLTEGSVSTETRFKGEEPSGSLSDIARIFQEVQKFKSVAGSKSYKVFQTITPVAFQQSCGSGFSDDNNTPDDTSDDSFQISLNCSGFGAGKGASASGSFSSTPVYTSGVITHYQFLYGNYALTNKQSVQLNQNQPGSGISTETSSRNGSVLLDVAAQGTCFRGSAFENTAGTFNLSGIYRRDSDGDNIFEVDEEFALTNLVITIAETPACTAGPVTITMNGTRSFTDHFDPTRSTASTFNNVQLVVTPTKRSINGILTNGFDYSLSGGMTVSTPNTTVPCLNASHTINTETPFFVAVGASCAVLGKQLLTNTTSGEITAVTATPAGGLDVDVGNDGLIEQNFVTCREAAVCTP